VPPTMVTMSQKCPPPPPMPPARTDCNYQNVTDNNGCTTDYQCVPVMFASGEQPSVLPVQAVPPPNGAGAPPPPPPPPPSGVATNTGTTWWGKSTTTPVPTPQPSPTTTISGSSTTWWGVGGQSSTTAVPTPFNPPVVSPGQDYDPKCCFWAERGDCDTNQFWMRPFCQKSCGTFGCTVDTANTCVVNLNVADCPWHGHKKPPQILPSLESAPITQQKPSSQTWQPVPNFPPGSGAPLPPFNGSTAIPPPPPPGPGGNVGPNPPPNPIPGPSGAGNQGANPSPSPPIGPSGGCTNVHHLCNFWAFSGECDKNAAWMLQNCGQACKAC